MGTFRYMVGRFGELLVRSPEGMLRPVGRIHMDHGRLTWMGLLRPLARDLLHIATAVHHVDRVSPRSLHQTQGSPDTWHRQFELELTVAEPSLWNSVRSDLKHLLHWLTDDQWELTFKRSELCTPWQADLYSERLDDAEEIALFSGGLDSVAGAHVRLQERGGALYLFSSLGTSVRERFLNNARSVLKKRGLRHRWIGFRHQLRNTGTSTLDATQRTRGFLFLCAAVAAADTLSINTVATYECGVGALNLPMNAAQVGAQNTRAMHPWTLMQVERILRVVLEKPQLRLEAPFLLKTKGELCHMAGADLAAVARVSNSCDETERNKHDTNEHCGVCTSCLLRRASIHWVLGKSDPTLYRLTETRRNGQYQINVFEEQARCFSEMTRYADLVNYSHTVDRAVDYLLERIEPKLSRPEAQNQILSLFQRHAAEVLSFYDQQAPHSLRERPRKPLVKQDSHDLLRAAW